MKKNSEYLAYYGNGKSHPYPSHYQQRQKHRPKMNQMNMLSHKRMHAKKRRSKTKSRRRFKDDYKACIIKGKRPVTPILGEVSNKIRGYCDVEQLKAKIFMNKRKHGHRFNHLVDKLEHRAEKEIQGPIKRKRTKKRRRLLRN